MKAILTTILLFFMFGLFAQSDNEAMVAINDIDTVVTITGDILTGEIKSMRKGIVDFGTDYTDSDIKLKWLDIISLKSQRLFTVFNTRQKTLAATIEIDSISPNTVKVKSGINAPILFSKAELVEITQLENSVFDRLEFGIYAGFSFTKSNDTQQISLRSNLGYKARAWKSTANYNTYNTTIDTVESGRTDAFVNYQYLLGHAWFVAGQIEWLHNEEQDLNLRTNTNFGIGRYLSKTNQSYFYLTFGPSFNNEDYVGDSNDLQSYETFLGAYYELYGNSDIEINTNGTTFFSARDSERFRVNYQLDLKWDFLDDFNTILGYTLNYDSNPPNKGSKSDFVISLTLGWEL